MTWVRMPNFGFNPPGPVTTGTMDSLARTTVFMPSGSRSSGLAPAAMSRRAASIWPARAAKSRAVKPWGAGPSSPVRRGGASFFNCVAVVAWWRPRLGALYV